MYLSEVTIRPHIVVDNEPSQQMSKTDNPTTINIENVINITRDESSMAGNEPNTTLTSPNPSMRSFHVSIASIESDAESSAIESDIDEFEDTKTGCMVKKLGQQTTNLEEIKPISSATPEIAILLGQTIDAGGVPSVNAPQVTSLSLANSTDVTFGQKKYHRGPVTIQQILIEKPKNQENRNPASVSSTGCSSAAGRTREPERDVLRDNPPPQIYKYILNHKAAIITAIIVVLILLIGVMVISTLKIIQGGVLQDVCSTDCGNTSLLISRDEWVAQPPNARLGDLETPVTRVIVTHTTTQNCTAMPICVLRTRIIQTYDMESRSLDDIRYNFLVGGDGKVYVGRGWDKVGAHTKGYNDDSVGIAFIGTFNKWAPPEIQLNATKWLLREGVRLNKLDPDFKLYGSRQLDLSDGPGDVLYDIIIKWPNWSNEVLNAK